MQSGVKQILHARETGNIAVWRASPSNTALASGLHAILTRRVPNVVLGVNVLSGCAGGCHPRLWGNCAGRRGNCEAVVLYLPGAVHCLSGGSRFQKSLTWPGVFARLLFA